MFMPLQTPVQQSLEDEHSMPLWKHSHFPDGQEPWQQSASYEQSCWKSEHWQRPLAPQFWVQQSLPDWHAWPGMPHVQAPVESQAPPQQS